MPVRDEKGQAERCQALAKRLRAKGIDWSRYNQIDTMDGPLRELESLMTEVEGMERARAAREKRDAEAAEAEAERVAAIDGAQEEGSRDDAEQPVTG